MEDAMAMKEGTEMSGNGKIWGGYVAAFLSVAIGLFVMALVQIGTVLNDGFKDFVFDVGKAWIPNAQGIGPYAGKETFMLVAWIGSWLLLHAGLKGRQLPGRPWFYGFMATLIAATFLMWPPVWHLLEGG